MSQLFYTALLKTKEYQEDKKVQMLQQIKCNQRLNEINDFQKQGIIICKKVVMVKCKSTLLVKVLKIKKVLSTGIIIKEGLKLITFRSSIFL